MKKEKLNKKCVKCKKTKTTNTLCKKCAEHFWIDPAGGIHSDYDSDPAAKYI